MLLNSILRRFRRSPGDALAVVITLSIGLGVLCAVWALVDGVLLRPLPYAEPERLFVLWDEGAMGAHHLTDVAFKALRDSPGLSGNLAVYGELSAWATWTGQTDAVRLAGTRVSSEFFDVLAVAPARGRAFASADETIDAAAVVVVSDRWCYAAAPECQPGDTLVLDEVSYTIRGVTPAGFSFPTAPTDFWIPIIFLPNVIPSAEGGGSIGARVSSFSAVGRLARGMTLVAVREQAVSVVGSVDADARILARPLLEVVTESVRTPLLVLQAAAVAVLALAMVNVGWLFAWRVRRLEHTLTVMRALGATRARIVASQVAESLVMVSLAIPGAMLTAWILLQGILSNTAGAIPRAESVRMNLAGATVAILVGLVGGACAALPSALMTMKVSINPRQRDRSPRLRSRRQYAAMVCQAAVVFALAVQAIQLALLLQQALNAPLGFTNDDLLAARATLVDQAAGDAASRAGQYDELVGRLEASGISASVTNSLPLMGTEHFRSLRLSHDQRGYDMVGMRLVNSTFFQTVGLPIRAGRPLVAQDQGHMRAIVNDVLAQQLFGGIDDAIGRRLVLGGRQLPTPEVVGVVESVRYSDLLEQPGPEVYILHVDAAALGMAVSSDFFLVWGQGAGNQSTVAVREVVADVLPGARITTVKRLDDLVWEAAGSRPIVTFAVTGFATVGLGLMLLGSYGLTSRSLARRSREIAIRLAVGARPIDVLAVGARNIATVFAGGLLVGSAAVAMMRSWVRSTIFVPPGVPEPSVLLVGTIAAVLLGGVVTLASYRPLRRAIQTDPALALRAE